MHSEPLWESEYPADVAIRVSVWNGILLLEKKTSPCSCLYSCNSRSLFMRLVSGSKDRPACNVEWYLVVRISLWNIRPLRTSHFQFELAPKTGTLQLIGNSISSPINRGGLSIGYRCIVLTAICFEFCFWINYRLPKLAFFHTQCMVWNMEMAWRTN